MKRQTTIEPIGYIRSDFQEKFGIPRQSGRAPSAIARVVLYPEYNSPDCFREIEGFSHIWLLFDFSATRDEGWSATVRPPRLGGNKRVGVFASRSPFRPNYIGLSCVKLLRVEQTKTGVELVVSGADLLDNTPIFDIKPYLPHADCVDGATGGYAAQGAQHRLEVEFPESLLQSVPQEKRAGLIECLADDPRPAYKDEPERIYGMHFADLQVRFRVQGAMLTVVEVEK
ncbi:MAG: tRNA (N6-threonylcarbamoyladenosine(37)-N6)-methyltransferase TrmO [Clostridia bacterium]|nr:tRNA (N6-threonylcarbamoyladenosine(37)-N6)-methyltransferase TrmO [Clostridia bacterium]